MNKLFNALAILVLGAAHVASAATWGLAETRVFSGLKDVTVVAQKFDATGGFVEMELSGTLYGFCPGGVERIRMEWRFDRDVSRVSGGEKLTATLDARQTGVRAPCTDSYSRRLTFSFGGSNGAVNPFGPAETALINGSIFWPSSGARIFARDDNRKGPLTGSINIDPREPGPDRPMAWFSFLVATSGGNYEIVYLYDTRKVAGATAGGAGTCPPCEAAAKGMRWEAVRVGDCTGRDTGNTNGFSPDERQAKAGATAVCWDGEALRNASAPARMWCTYKNIEAVACTGGSNPGVLYRAVNR
jgi:hypothetical protein